MIYMDKDQVRDLLYEYVTGRLDNNTISQVENELRNSVDLQHKLKTLRDVINILEDYHKPEPSTEFVTRLKSSIIEQNDLSGKEKTRAETANITKFLDKLFSLIDIGLPTKAVGAAAIAILVFLAFSLYYQNYNVDKIRSSDNGVVNQYYEAQTPILIASDDIKNIYNNLINIIDSVNGNIVRRKLTNKGLIIYIHVDPEKESYFINELKTVAQVPDKYDQFKDSEGNIVVELRE